MDMNALFAAFKTHLSDATQQLSGDFRQVVDENTRFKQEMREELDEMKKNFSRSEKTFRHPVAI
jgi:vacuolar-type H+-ATPase subunit D/Vma8